MKKIAIIALLAMVLIVGVASAYVLTIDCPLKLPVGAPLPVMGTTTFPAGTTVDLVFSSSGQTSNMISTVPVTIGEDKNFNVVFETTGLNGGMYKVEAIPRGDYQSKLSSDSITIRVVELIDRSDMLHITSPINQVIPNALLIEGYISKAGNSGVKLDVIGPVGKAFGPAYIGTASRSGNPDGYFSQYISVEEPGNYNARFSDSTGYIGEKIFGVKATVTPVPVVTTEGTLLFTPTPTTPRPVQTKTQVPTPTKSDAPVAGIIAGLGIAGFFALRK
ncbi:MAG: hypothetical protein NTV68_07015 [Methanomicrobiales archaeon]|nr:hypothetical protein [Methanomicrobiales archaeon]